MEANAIHAPLSCWRGGGTRHPDHSVAHSNLSIQDKSISRVAMIPTRHARVITEWKYIEVSKAIGNPDRCSAIVIRQLIPISENNLHLKKNATQLLAATRLDN